MRFAGVGHGASKTKAKKEAACMTLCNLFRAAGLHEKEQSILLGHINKNGWLGRMDDIFNMTESYPEAIVALGNNETRMKYHNRLKAAGFSVPVLIHPTAYVSPDAVLSPGCIVRAKAVVSRYARLDEACIVNVGGLIDHDCVLGDGCHVLMGAVIRNEVVLPEKTWLASNQVAE